MLDNHFKTSAQQVASLLSKHGIDADVYQILNLADSLVEGKYNFTAPVQDATHDSLVATALSTHEVMWSLRDSKKIMAIKALRGATGCGLKAAKDACEDDRVLASVALLSDPWGMHLDRDEPQF